MNLRTAVLAAIVAITLSACGSSSPPASQPAKSKDVDRVVDIGGGRSLHLACSGTGSPTILLEAGDESGTEDWGGIAPELAKHSRTCAYDRIGVGQSSEATGCRRLDDILGDLEALLSAVRIKAPYVLVGASGGGFLMAGFAARHPADTAGLVLAEVPKAIVTDDKELLAEIRCDAPNNVEHRDYASVEHAVWDSKKLIGDFPLRLISNRYPEGIAGDGSEQTNVQDQRGWLKLSPDAKQVVVTSGHDVTTNEAPLVTKQILEVLEEARAG